MHIINVEPSPNDSVAVQMETSNQFPEITAAREAFSSGKTLPIEFRRRQLSNLQKMLHDEKSCEKIYTALHKDMRKSRFESFVSEVCFVRHEVQFQLMNLKKFTSPEKLSRNFLTLTNSAQIRSEPHGVVLIIGPWNYPFYCTLVALAGAIAAGNCVILKPSEISEHSSQLTLELFRRFLDNNCYHVFLGDVERTKALLTNRFDYIFFTGSTNVGRIIMQTAAKHLTPVTLELGGKSATIWDRFVWVRVLERPLEKVQSERGRLQFCDTSLHLIDAQLCADFLICTKEVQQKFLMHVKDVFQEMYGTSENLQNVPEFGRIINVNNFRRLKNMLRQTNGTILFGGNTDEKDLWIEPTIVGNVQRNDSLMEDEIFGPILPIVTVSSADEAIHFLRSLERPLALYIFSRNKKITQRVLDSVPSGGVMVNELLLHISDLRVPFGGTGMSGMGRYHGKYSFDTFSHKRAVVTSGLSYISEKFIDPRYPPATSFNFAIANFYYSAMNYCELKAGTKFRILTYLIAMAVGYLLSSFVSDKLEEHI